MSDPGNMQGTLQSFSAVVCRSFGIQVLVWLVIVLTCFGSVEGKDMGFAASKAESDREGDNDEKMVDQFLDQILRIDPEAVPVDSGETGQPPGSIKYGLGVYAGYGVESNVLNLRSPDIESEKYYSAVDFYFSGWKGSPYQLDFYTIFENTAFPRMAAENDKREFFSRIIGKRKVTGSAFIGTRLSYLNQHLFDTDTVIENESVPGYRNEEVLVSPFWEMKFGSDSEIFTEFEFLVKKTEFPEDDFSRQRMRVICKDLYGKKSENRLTLEYDVSEYSDAEVSDVQGYSIENTRLSIEAGSVGLLNRHRFSTSYGPVLVSNLVYYHQKDNGPGYQDYGYYYLNESFSLNGSGWQINSNLGYTHYLYDEREVWASGSEPERFFQAYTSLSVEFSWQFSNEFTLKTSTMGLISDSNDSEENYTSYSCMISLIYYL